MNHGSYSCSVGLWKPLRGQEHALQVTPPAVGASGFEYSTPPDDTGTRLEPDSDYQPRAAAKRRLAEAHTAPGKSRLKGMAAGAPAGAAKPQGAGLGSGPVKRGAGRAGARAAGKRKTAPAKAKRGAAAAAGGQKNRKDGGGGGAGGGAAAEAPGPSREAGGSFTGVLRKVQDAPDAARMAKQPQPSAAPQPAGPSRQAEDLQEQAAGEEPEQFAAEEASSESEESSPEPERAPSAATAAVALQARTLRVEAPAATLALATATLAVRGDVGDTVVLPAARAARAALEAAAPARKPPQAPRKRAAPTREGPVARGPDDADAFEALPDLPQGVFSRGIDVAAGASLGADEEAEEEEAEEVCTRSRPLLLKEALLGSRSPALPQAGSSTYIALHVFEKLCCCALSVFMCQ